MDLNKYIEAGDAYQVYGEKSPKATLNDHYREGLSYYLAIITGSVDAFLTADPAYKPDKH